MTTWNASNYRQRKAVRVVKVKPEWFTNPDTGESFYLRNARGLASSVFAGYLPSGLTETAVKAWQEKGVDGLENDASITEIISKMSPEDIEAGNREMRRKSEVIQQCCVIPFLSNQNPDSIEFTPEWRADAIAGLKEKDPEFDESKFDPKELVLDPRELDDQDSTWLFKWAAGLVGLVAMKGGGVAKVDDIARFRKKPGRRTRTRGDGAQLQQTA